MIEAEYPPDCEGGKCNLFGLLAALQAVLTSSGTVFVSETGWAVSAIAGQPSACTLSTSLQRNFHSVAEKTA